MIGPAPQVDRKRGRGTIAAIALATASAALAGLMVSPAAGVTPQTKVVIVGGPSAVSTAVETALASCPALAVSRIAGTDRFETAARISEAVFTAPGSAMIATGLNFPDALAAGPAAGLAGEPVLLVGTGTPASTLRELTRLRVTRTTIVGGPASVAPEVESDLATFGPTERLAGGDRYATAASIASARFRATGGTVYVATGTNFPDALTGVPAAAAENAPILLVEPDTIPSPTASQLSRLAPRTIRILGGTAAISDKTAAALSAYAPTVERLAGSDRYATAATISRHTFPKGAQTIYLTTGENYADALAAGPAAAERGAPLLLVANDHVPASTMQELLRLSGRDCTPTAPPPTGSPVTFTVVGDIGARSASTATLGLIPTIGPDAHFAAGDLSYSQITPESAWCDYVRSIVGNATPFEVLSGNHEDDGGRDGNIRNFAKCLPDTLGAVGDYGVQYYVDLGNVVRVIAISPDLQIDGVPYTYARGSTERAWLESAVAGARAKNLWVAIIQHKVCINAAEKSCQIGEELASWEASAADIVIMGHSHTYERSHQLSCVVAGTTAGSCIVDTDGNHRQGVGAVLVINGLGGKDRSINRSDSEAGYFASLMGSGDPQAGHGLLRVDVDETTITGTFVGADTAFTDTFSLSR